MLRFRNLLRHTIIRRQYDGFLLIPFEAEVMDLINTKWLADAWIFNHYQLESSLSAACWVPVSLRPSILALVERFRSTDRPQYQKNVAQMHVKLVKMLQSTK
jgi:hypothetical protein